MMLADGISIELGAEGQPHLYPMIPNSSSNKGKRKQPRKGHFCNPSLWACARKMAVRQASGLPSHRWASCVHFIFAFTLLRFLKKSVLVWGLSELYSPAFTQLFITPCEYTAMTSDSSNLLGYSSDQTKKNTKKTIT